jgi:glutaredoxin
LPVVLYVVPGCPLCAEARSWLIDRQVDFVERDVANDYSALRRMYKLTRQGLVPVIESNGKALVRPDQEALNNTFSA